jgi:uncharacterized membrane protein
MTLFQFISERICHLDPVILAGFRDGTLLLCPRCAGLHTGFILILFICLMNIPGVTVHLNNGRMIFVLALTSIALFHWMAGVYGFTESSPQSRLITGLLSGSAFAVLVFSYMNPALTFPRIFKSNEELKEPAGIMMKISEASKQTFRGLITLLLMATITGYLFLNIADITILKLVLPMIILINFTFLIWIVIRIIAKRLISHLI